MFQNRTITPVLAYMGFALYVAIAVTAGLILPLAFAVFLVPFAILVFLHAPTSRPVPMRVVWPILFFAVALMPVWPTYIHIRVGPLPIFTPPRILFYVLTAIFFYDMAVSRVRRGRLLYVVQQQRYLVGAAFVFFALGALSVIVAEGKSAAAQAYIRQVIIWGIPFLIGLTYVRNFSDFSKIIKAVILGAVVISFFAIGEVLTKTLLVKVLSPLIMTQAEWLAIAQSTKIRDGVFRAQSTHTHPISLAEFLSFCVPVCAMYAYRARSHARLLWAGVLLVIVLGALATNSRAAIIAVAATGMLTSALICRQILASNASAHIRPLVGLAILFLVAASPIAAVGGYVLTTGEVGTSTARSSQARIDQINIAWPKIKKRPVGGYGVGRATRIVGYYGTALTLDNYYLSLAIDRGIPGPIVFLAVLVLGSLGSYRAANGASTENIAPLYGFAVALAGIIITRMIISQTGNLNFLWPMLGAFAGACTYQVKTPVSLKDAAQQWFVAPSYAR